MRILNIHTRQISASIAQIKPLLLTLGSAQDCVWPHEDWPRMQLDRPLQVGASGGHGPIRYRVSICDPERRVRFEFLRGSQGFHEIELQTISPSRTLLTHTVDTRPSLTFLIAWHLTIRHMHDAVVEDLFDKLQAQFEPLPQRNRWSRYQRFLRARAGWPTHATLLANRAISRL